eukprot:gene25760-biopygen1485
MSKLFANVRRHCGKVRLLPPYVRRDCDTWLFFKRLRILRQGFLLHQSCRTKVRQDSRLMHPPAPPLRGGVAGRDVRRRRRARVAGPRRRRRVRGGGAWGPFPLHRQG